jgi:hypothetical protein
MDTIHKKCKYELIHTAQFVPTTIPSTTSPPTTTAPLNPATPGGIDAGSIVGIVSGIVAIIVAIIGIFTAAFVDAFRYWVLFSVPNALCCRHRQPTPGSRLDQYIRGVEVGR